MHKNTFSDRIKFARSLRGLSQSALANSAGSSRSMIYSYEAGSRLPRGATLLRLASILNVSPQWLMEGEGPMEPTESLGTQDTTSLSEDWTRDSRGNFARHFRAIPIVRRIDSIPALGDLSIAADLLERCLPIDDILADQLGPRTFAIYIPDQGIQPIARAGDIAIADPDIAPVPGNIVVATDEAEQEFLVRRYKKSNEGTRVVDELVAEGKYWPTLRIGESIKLAGTVRVLLQFTRDYRDSI